jgi:hypothetical protein
MDSMGRQGEELKLTDTSHALEPASMPQYHFAELPIETVEGKQCLVMLHHYSLAATRILPDAATALIPSLSMNPLLKGVRWIKDGAWP